MRALVLTLALLAGTAQAGRSCEPQPPQVEGVTRGLELAERTARALDASGAEVVVLARAGQDLSSYGLRWSHLGFAYRLSPATAQSPGTWRVVHKLNDCGSERAGLYRQGLGEFFLDSPHRYEAVFVPLQGEAAEQLAPLLRDNRAVQRLHQPRYSMVSYAWGTRYQQSNQWLLETFALIEPGVRDRETAQAWLKLKGFQPSRLHINAMTRLGARVTRANVAFDDHPNAQRFAGRIDTVGADAVLAWLQQNRFGGAPVYVR
ncbi:DUF2145 domain-containing protein [Inhella sp.]|uniref:DUF2145 domain-containing protein n=1 Tax=Inhella sp. TaxID=1921806 RepID=UPI0035B0ACE9